MGAVGTAAADEGHPLARLFAIGLRSMVDELHVRLEARGWSDVRPTFGFVLLATRDRAITGTELATLMGTTKQATSKLSTAMANAGYIEAFDSTEDARQRPFRITDRGLRLLAAVEEIYAELEAEWADVIGGERLEALRADLTSVLTARHSGRLPAVRPTT